MNDENRQSKYPRVFGAKALSVGVFAVVLGATMYAVRDSPEQLIDALQTFSAVVIAFLGVRVVESKFK